MTWFLIFGLGLWIFMERGAVKALEKQVRALEARLRLLETPPTPAPAARRSKAATAVPRTEAPVMAAEAAPAPVLAAPEPLPTVEPAVVRPPRPERPKINLAAWLSEHGLAWLGGGALALGGLFLVAYAAQRGVFTPALRIATAIAVGFVMLGAGEWLRRRMTESRRGPAAALLSGAGAATLYGAVWAAHRLYGFIELPATAPLLGLISAGLLALAFIHGAPLALVAVFGAYLAPVVTNGPDWGDGPLTAYLLLILVTGYGVAALRGWGHVAWAATAGAVIWALANLADADGIPTALLLLASPALAMAAVTWRVRKFELMSADPLARSPAVALIASTVASTYLWMNLTAPDAPAIVSSGLALLAALAVGARLIGPAVQVAPYALAMVCLVEAGLFPGLSRFDLTIPGLATVLAVILASFWTAHRAQDASARLWAATGPGLAALTLCLLTGPLRQDEFVLGWTVPGAAAAICALAAAWLGPRIETRKTDLGLAVWIWAAAVLAARAMVAGFEWEGVALGVTVLTLAAATLHDRVGWRGFGAAAVASAVALLAALAAVGLRAVEEDLAVWAMAVVFVAATGGLWAASRLVRGAEPRSGLSDALSTGAVIAGLMGLFLLLRLRAGVPTAGELEPLLEVGLNVLLLLAAGVMTARGASPDSGPIARWRPHLFLGLGLIYGVFVQLLGLNPLWNATSRPILGPPIVDGLLIAYLAPAALLAFAARRQISPHRIAAAIYAGGATVFALAWGVTELRRLFKGPGYAWGPDVIGRAEGCAYALLAIAAAWGLAWIARRRKDSQIAGDLDLAARGLQWAALVAGAYVFGYAANPWWGPITRPFADHPAAILLLALHAVGVAGWLAFAGQSLFGRAARVAAALQVFVLLTLLIRYGFRGLDMSTAMAEARLETWVFSAAWALYGLAVLALGAVRRDLWLRWTGLVLLLATTAKVFLFDMARLDGMIRAASFLAVGALLIVAALAARQFRGGGKESDEAAEA